MAAIKEFGASAEDSTVIGPSILISGKLSGDEDLTIRGRVEGEISLNRTLNVDQSGIVKANVSVRSAIVSGVVVGNITASESVEIARDGRMVGDIHSPRVILVDGASFKGRIEMGNVEQRSEVQRPTARPVERSAARPAMPAAIARAPMSKPVLKATTSTVMPALRSIGRSSVEVKPLPPPPPQPIVVAGGGKKKIVLKKKK